MDKPTRLLLIKQRADELRGRGKTYRQPRPTEFIAPLWDDEAEPDITSEPKHKDFVNDDSE